MGAKKRVMPAILLSAFAFIGSIGMITPNCLGWFYEPRKPNDQPSK